METRRCGHGRVAVDAWLWTRRHSCGRADAWLRMPGHGRGGTAVDARTRDRGLGDPTERTRPRPRGTSWKVRELVNPTHRPQPLNRFSCPSLELSKLGQESRVTVERAAKVDRKVVVGELQLRFGEEGKQILGLGIGGLSGR